MCRHFLQGWHWCSVPCWCGWHRQHVEGAEESAEDEWCSCQRRFAWGLASGWIKRCRCEYQTGKWRNPLRSHHCDRGKSQNAAWWSPPTACLAAHRLKPKAGEANQRQQMWETKRSARSRLGYAHIPCKVFANMEQATKSKVSSLVVFFAAGLNSASSLSASDFPLSASKRLFHEWQHKCFFHSSSDVATQYVRYLVHKVLSKLVYRYLFR